MDRQFGEDGVILDRVTDSAHLLRLADKIAIEEALIAFEKRFPQLFFCLYLGALPALASIRQFGFWLLNRAAVSCVDFTRPNEHGILLVVDITSKSIGFTLGYYVEKFIEEKDLLPLLREAKPAFSRGETGQGLLGLIEQMDRLCAKRAKQATRRPERFISKPQPVPAGQDLKRLREGNVPQKEPKQKKKGKKGAKS